MPYLGLEVAKPAKPPKKKDTYVFLKTTADQVITNEETDERLDELIEGGIVKRTDVIDHFGSGSADLPASARLVDELNSNLNGVSFVLNDDGTIAGYTSGGADTVHPFKSITYAKGEMTQNVGKYQSADFNFTFDTPLPEAPTDIVCYAYSSAGVFTVNSTSNVTTTGFTANVTNGNGVKLDVTIKYIAVI